VPPTALGGGTTARNFSVGGYVSHLDIVVVKDSPDARVSVLAPNGQRFPPPAAGTFISTDPYYSIFAIDAPQQGTWELDVSGGGQFLMNSLKTSTLSLTMQAPTSGAVAALGEPFTLAAQLSNQGAPVSGGQFSISGTVTATGGSDKGYTQDVALADPDGTGTYSAKITVPASAPAGSYAITIKAHAASEDVLSTSAVIRLDLFPSALLVSPATGKPTTESVGADAVGWDGALRVLYSLPLVGGLGGLPLDGRPAVPSAVVRGQVQLNGQPYDEATVTATAARAGAKTTIPVTVANDGGGRFHLVFPSAASGTYAVTIATQGAYKLVHGDLTHSTRTVLVTVRPATLGQEVRAWIVTALYLLLLIFLVLLVRYILSPKPYGTLLSTEGEGGLEFARAQRMPWTALLSPSTVRSGEMGMDPGLLFRFHGGSRITVQGTGERDNYLLRGEAVPTAPVPAGVAELTTADGTISYSVTADRRATGDDDEFRSAGQEVWARVRGRPSRDDEGDIDDDTGRGRGFSLFGPRRRADFDDDDNYGRRAGRSRARSRDDDDYDARPRRRSRRTRYDDDDY
jgi:hypothetical protein